MKISNIFLPALWLVVLAVLALSRAERPVAAGALVHAGNRKNLSIFRQNKKISANLAEIRSKLKARASYFHSFLL